MDIDPKPLAQMYLLALRSLQHRLHGEYFFSFRRIQFGSERGTTDEYYSAQQLPLRDQPLDIP